MKYANYFLIGATGDTGAPDQPEAQVQRVARAHAERRQVKPSSSFQLVKA